LSQAVEQSSYNFGAWCLDNNLHSVGALDSAYNGWDGASTKDVQRFGSNYIVDSLFHFICYELEQFEVVVLHYDNGETPERGEIAGFSVF